MDEESTQYEVVSYDDARAIAQDAAESASALVSVREDSDLRSVAESAADASASSALDGALAEIDARMDEVAEKAANGAVSGVQESLDQQTLALRDAQQAIESATVAIDAEQYDAIMLQMRAGLGASVVSMLLAAALFGSALWLVCAREVGR